MLYEATLGRRQRRSARRRTGDAPGTERAGPPVQAPLRVAHQVERLAYTPHQAAEALGVSVATLDRRVLPSIETVKLPSGARLIPVVELERLLERHREPGPRVCGSGCRSPRADPE